MFYGNFADEGDLSLYSIFDSNKLMAYLFWSPTKTINFFYVYD